MKKTALLLFCCVSITLNSYSQTKHESIKELFHLMQKDSIIDRTISSMLPTLFKMEQQKNPSLTAHAKDSIVNRLLLAKELSAKIQNEEIALYDKYFTQEEIADLIAFYKSPSGKKLIEITPKIQNDLMIITQQKYGSDLIKLVISMNNHK